MQPVSIFNDATRYAGCRFKNTTKRGAFGDALAEADWIVGNVVTELTTQNLTKNTLIMFTGDNGTLVRSALNESNTFR